MSPCAPRSSAAELRHMRSVPPYVFEWRPARLRAYGSWVRVRYAESAPARWAWRGLGRVKLWPYPCSRPFPGAFYIDVGDGRRFYWNGPSPLPHLYPFATCLGTIAID